jgi:hypothetical protein
LWEEQRGVVVTMEDSSRVNSSDWREACIVCERVGSKMKGSIIDMRRVIEMVMGCQIDIAERGHARSEVVSRRVRVGGRG